MNWITSKTGWWKLLGNMDFLPIIEDEQFLPPKEWREVIDRLISREKFIGDEVMGQLERMSETQKWCLQEIKKSHARLNK